MLPTKVSLVKAMVFPAVMYGCESWTIKKLLLLLLLLTSRFSRVQLCVTLWTAAHQAPLSTEFSRHEYWRGLPFTSPKESWALKNWWLWTVVLEETLESPLDWKEIQPVHPKGDQSWISLEVLMLKLKLQYSGHLMWRSDSLEKTQMLGKVESRRRRG